MEVPGSISKAAIAVRRRAVEKRRPDARPSAVACVQNHWDADAIQLCSDEMPPAPVTTAVGLYGACTSSYVAAWPKCHRRRRHVWMDRARGVGVRGGGEVTSVARVLSPRAFRKPYSGVGGHYEASAPSRCRATATRRLSHARRRVESPGTPTPSDISLAWPPIGFKFSHRAALVRGLPPGISHRDRSHLAVAGARRPTVGRRVKRPTPLGTAPGVRVWRRVGFSAAAPRRLLPPLPFPLFPSSSLLPSPRPPLFFLPIFSFRFFSGRQVLGSGRRVGVVRRRGPCTAKRRRVGRRVERRTGGVG